MTNDKLERIARARDEALRFVKRCDEVIDRYDTDEYFARYIGICGFRETAAVKRASMDLSRALSELRK